MISLCMIVKNEAAGIENCLKQVIPLVDQVVIVDTGSTDATKEIALSYTKDVYDFKWCNDFSKARNFSLDQAAYDWVLVLDADEMIQNFDRDKCLESIRTFQNQVGRIKRINPYEEGEVTQKYIERVNRVFNRKIFCYEGAIHEQIVRRDGNAYETFDIDIVANHIGYTKEVIATTNKLERNITMLKEALQDHPTDPYLHYQLGKSYFKAKRYSESFNSFNEALLLGVDLNLEYAKDLVESFGYAHLKCERYAESLRFEQYRDFYGLSPDYNFLMGLIYMNNARFDEAIGSFKKCIGEKEGNMEGINSYQPHYNIGVIYEVLGNLHQAFDHYQKSIVYTHSQKRYHVIKEQFIQNMDVEIKQVESDLVNGHYELVKLKSSNLRSISDVHQLKIYEGIADIIDGSFLQGIALLTEAFDETPDDYDIAFNIALGYKELGRFDEAGRWIEKILKQASNQELLEETVRLNDLLKIQYQNISNLKS